MDNINKSNTPKWINKVLDTLNIKKRAFSTLYPIKWVDWVKKFCFHLDKKQKIINQFTDKDVIDYLNDSLPEWNILYIDYFEIRSCRRDNWVWTKVVQDIINKSRKIWISWIYLDSYEVSIDFWERNWFTVDSDIQENINWEISDNHCSSILLKW